MEDRQTGKGNMSAIYVLEVQFDKKMCNLCLKARFPFQWVLHLEKRSLMLCLQKRLCRSKRGSSDDDRRWVSTDSMNSKGFVPEIHTNTHRPIFQLKFDKDRFYFYQEAIMSFKLMLKHDFLCVCF